MEKTKSDIRKEYLAKRKALSKYDIDTLSQCISSTLFATNEYKQCKDILLYSSYNNEVSTDVIVHRALRDSKNVYFPKVNGKEMDFFSILDAKELIPGNKGILEPTPKMDNIFKDSDCSLMILPLSVYDRSGNRIGYGGGYYDKYLATHNIDTKIGIAYSLQEYSGIPTETTDIKLDYIINEKEVIKIING